jgi:DNA replication licensing factor MCM2
MISMLSERDELNSADIENPELLEEDDEGEDLFDENFQQDYRANSELDYYDARDIDDAEFSELSIGDRLVVDEILNRRDRAAIKDQGRVPKAFIEDDVDISAIPRRRRLKASAQEFPGERMSDDEFDLSAIDPNFPISDLKDRTVAEWVGMEQTRRHVAYRFKKFLNDFVDNNNVKVYMERITRMCENNGRSFELDYRHLHSSVQILALYLSDAPSEMLEIFDEVAQELVSLQFEFYSRVRKEIHVRISNLPLVENIRDLRHFHVNKLIKIKGVVTRRSTVLPQLKHVVFSCMKCNYSLGPYATNGNDEVKPSVCPSCEGKGPFQIKNEQSSYRDYQRISLQESPGSVLPGRLPRSKEIILLADLVDYVRPGEEIVN